ncbi:MAG: hypothetical protein ABIP56_06655 [Dokdonella sp.]
MSNITRIPRLLAIAAICACAPIALAQKIEDGPKAVKPERLAYYWTLDNSSVEADVPNMARGIAQATCAAVSFIVESDGSTSHVKVQKVEPESQLRGIAQSMGQHIRFNPTVDNMGRDRIFSWLIFPFNMPSDPARRTAIMQPCSLDTIAFKDR